MAERKARAVSKFEGRLLAIVRATVRLAPAETALPHLMDRMPVPPALSTTCLELVCDSLAKGCVQFLARAGGWRRERFLVGGVPVEGRLWERSPVADRRLDFSVHTLDFFRWLTAMPAGQAKAWDPPAAEVTIADELVMAMAYDAFHDSEAGAAWRGRPVFARNPLCRLSFPEDFGAQPAHAPDYSAWVAGLGGAILEGLQRPLSERWIAVERGKRAVGDWPTMKALGAAQELVLDRFASAVESSGRYDLARFLLHAAAESCRTGSRAADYVGGLQGGGPRRLAERYDVHRRAGTLLRFLDRAAGWERQARGVGYLDDGYAAAQLFKADWEAAGAAATVERARSVLRELEPVRIEDEADEPSLSHSGQ